MMGVPTPIAESRKPGAHNPSPSLRTNITSKRTWTSGLNRSQAPASRAQAEPSSSTSSSSHAWTPARSPAPAVLFPTPTSAGVSYQERNTSPAPASTSARIGGPETQEPLMSKVSFMRPKQRQASVILANLRRLRQQADDMLDHADAHPIECSTTASQRSVGSPTRQRMAMQASTPPSPPLPSPHAYYTVMYDTPETAPLNYTPPSRRTGASAPSPAMMTGRGVSPAAAKRLDMLARLRALQHEGTMLQAIEEAEY